MVSTDGFYDELAPYFREYAHRRRAYLSGIDRLVEPRLTGTSLLDVGAGDGVRASRLAGRAGLDRLVLVEPSPAMAALCRKVGCCVHVVSIEELELRDQTFDHMTCLWNVLGHIPSHQRRVGALRKMASLLSAGGSLHLDVHNRYNGRSYGWTTVLANVARDFLRPDRENGLREFDLVFGNRRLHGCGYLFTPAEIERTIAAAGLRVIRRKIVDYDTGDIRRSAFFGQLYFELAP